MPSTRVIKSNSNDRYRQARRGNRRTAKRMVRGMTLLPSVGGYSKTREHDHDGHHPLRNV